MSASLASLRHRLVMASFLEDAQDGPHHRILPWPGELLHFARVEPGAVAGEAAVHLDVAEADLVKLHAALRAAHEMLLAQRLALRIREFFALLGCKLAQALRILAREILVLGAARLLRHDASDTGRMLLTRRAVAAQRRGPRIPRLPLV